MPKLSTALPIGVSRVPLILFEPVGIELQRSAVLSDCAHDLIASSLRKVRCNLEPDGHVGAHLADEVRDDLLGYPAGIATDASRIQCHSSKEAPNRRHRIGLATSVL